MTWATKYFPTQPTKWKTASTAELGPLYLCLQLPQEQVPELKPGIDLKAASSSTPAENPLCGVHGLNYMTFTRSLQN